MSNKASPQVKKQRTNIFDKRASPHPLKVEEAHKVKSDRRMFKQP